MMCACVLKRTSKNTPPGEDTPASVLVLFFLVLRLRESLTFVTLPETTVTSNKSYSYLHWVTIVMINSND